MNCGKNVHAQEVFFFFFHHHHFKKSTTSYSIVFFFVPFIAKNISQKNRNKMGFRAGKFRVGSWRVWSIGKEIYQMLSKFYFAHLEKGNEKKKKKNHTFFFINFSLPCYQYMCVALYMCVCVSIYLCELCFQHVWISFYNVMDDHEWRMISLCRQSQLRKIDHFSNCVIRMNAFVSPFFFFLCAQFFHLFPKWFFFIIIAWWKEKMNDYYYFRKKQSLSSIPFIYFQFPF